MISAAILSSLQHVNSFTTYHLIWFGCYHSLQCTHGQHHLRLPVGTISHLLLQALQLQKHFSIRELTLFGEGELHNKGLILTVT